MPKQKAINTVLLYGHLSEKELEDAASEIRDLEGEYSLVIESKSGDIEPAMDFMESLWAGGGRNLAGVKIYNAQSVAALIALCVQTYREISRGAILRIEQASTVIEAIDVDLENGTLDQEVLGTFRKYDTYLRNVLESCRLYENRFYVNKLEAGFLELNARQCLDLGLVKRIF